MLRSICEELLASSNEQERLLEALLTLASSERGLDHREPVDLRTLAEQALQTPRSDTERLGLRIATELAPAPASGDPGLRGSSRIRSTTPPRTTSPAG